MVSLFRERGAGVGPWPGGGSVPQLPARQGSQPVTMVSGLWLGGSRRRRLLGLWLPPARIFGPCRSSTMVDEVWKLAGVLAGLGVLQKSAGGVWQRSCFCALRYLSEEYALRDARRDWKEAFGRLTGPVLGWLSTEGTLVCGKEALFTRALSREQARSAQRTFGFQTVGDEVPENRLEGRCREVRSLGYGPTIG